MKISLAFGLAQQPIAKLWIKYGTVSKDLAAPGTRKHGIQGAPELLQDKSSFRNTQVWKPKLEAGMITDLDSRSDSRSDNEQRTGHPRKPRALPVARVLGRKKPKSRDGR
jgi:hypothetical protein